MREYHFAELPEMSSNGFQTSANTIARAGMSPPKERWNWEEAALKVGLEAGGATGVVVSAMLVVVGAAAED